MVHGTSRLLVTAIAAGLALAGCATHSANLRVGNAASMVSLSDQREAIRAVREYAVIPAGAEVIGPVDAGRCHRNWTETPPTRESVVSDLKVSAYIKGADGITDVKLEKESGLSDNCWYVLSGVATAFRLPAKAG
jgi:hypothetical protein